MEYSDIDSAARTHGLEILGGFHSGASDGLADWAKTLLLLGPSENFWSEISVSNEMLDGKINPMDRWSRRVIDLLAARFQAQAFYPFDGPPYHPFYSWALRTNRIWSSPVKLAVHETTGLFVSFRGALALPHRIDMPKPAKASPCKPCPSPCLTACPVDALTQDGYDVEACHAYLDTGEGVDCMQNGCKVRRSCPVGNSLRMPEQSAYHMSIFHPK